MNKEYYIGWVRDRKGAVVGRPRKSIANAVTTMSGGYAGEDGLGNTTAYIVREYE